MDDNVPDGHREEIFLHVVAAAGLESCVELVHRSRIEVRPVTPGHQHQVQRTLVVVIAELHRHRVVRRLRLRTILCQQM